MTYKTRQEVLRDAADWMDVCEKSGIIAKCKIDGYMMHVSECSFMQTPNMYEFPLALLEGKEVWVGSDPYDCDGNKFICTESHRGADFVGSGCSWNPPKPKTVMVELSIPFVRFNADLNYGNELVLACKKALENLK